jgi:pimeloyl-ACP methyl ester carboxylesterase/DNA-binding CsgD family transcriptional regulator
MAARQALRQHIRYVKTRDGSRLAWAEAGSGPVVVKAANWLTHLEYEWESPVWKHWLQFFSEHFRFVRYDERGCGMSEWRDVELTARIWTDDLEAVIDAAGPQGPVTLLGISQGSVACIGYALRHPERVSRLILYGGYARGPFLRGNPEAAATFRAVIELARVAWASDNPTFRQVFTSRFIPGGTPEQLAWFNELCRKTTPGEVAAKLLSTRASINIESELAALRVPTLVLHAREDGVVPVSEGRLLASTIPDAEFIELDSRNHILLEDEPAWQRFKEAVLAFLRPEAADGAAVFAALSAREREVLALIGDGLSNADIAARLSISDKTVRNHASNIFDKLGVWSRAQAIVFARDHGFRG